MLTLKFTKEYPASMVSHIDLLRIMNRIIRRADIDVDYSQGFNPHMLLFFAPPMTLGSNSSSEYVTVATNLSGEEAIDKLNKVCPDGISFLKAWTVAVNPNLAAIVDSAKYHISGENVGKADYKAIKSGNGYTIEYLDKGIAVTKDIADMVVSVEIIDDNNIEAVLSCGNKNLKADRFIKGVMHNNSLLVNDLKITKTNAYIDGIDADIYLNRLSCNNKQL